ncbi:Metallo-hydrolase/oxidoreductase [Periconia macrospinosa]|uniref:Metallo-hydrolase/oxidoreductase n=1 Tax=Periconia macrospinosa TaxID=97972 RepID=A0A2V1DW28_9PLEO|nr:Metallo-hydrolase/oxidoreductase [Periconia macrospinosa]
MSASAPLPRTDAYVELALLDGGSFIAESRKIHAGVENTTFRMYNWAFYIRNRGRHVLWDLGLDDGHSCYTPWVSEHILREINHVGPRKSLTMQLHERGVAPEDIDTVLFSHAHFDHARPISPTFPNATAFFGAGTKAYCAPGHLSSPASQWDGRFFDPNLATEKCEEILSSAGDEGRWIPFGPFDKALDYFGDGSFWIIQAPGHMPGNLCAAARLEGGQWVLLGSDCCHSRELLDGTQQIGWFDVPGAGSMSLHSDVDAAMDTIERIRVLERIHGVHVALAHDASWMMEGKDEVLMGLLSEEMKKTVGEKIEKGEVV